MKLSIIIPVFNVEDYLEKCLDSILSQDFKNLELILVNNNSTDRSLEIIKTYQKKYPKLIKGFNCKTWGASAARNLGVKKAKGEYLWFIDSDDWLEPGSIRKLVKKADKTKSDVVNFSVRRIYEDGHENILTAVNTDQENWRSRYIMYGFPPFQNLYRRDFWIENFEFPEGMIHEDMAILSSAVLYTDKVTYLDDILYNYYQRTGSVIHQKDFDPHSLDIFKALGILYGHFKKAGKLEKYYSELEYFYIWNLLIDSAKDFSKSKEGKAGIEQTRLTLKKLFPNWTKNKYFNKKSLKFKLNCFRGYLGLLH